MYLACKTLKETNPAILAHLDHGARGKDSDRDREFVERLGRTKGLPVEVRKIAMAKKSAGFENAARKARRAFLLEVKEKHGAEKILVAHTADDQVETVLMRILEGAGISGLKGIPRTTDDGIERPLLDTWRNEIVKYLQKHRIPYRVDKSNLDTRFERNWIRHVLIPLLEKRYGKSLKKRIFALGERFREIDEFLEETSRKWLKRHVKAAQDEGRGKAGGSRAPVRVGVRVPRESYSRLPSVVRKKILQVICFERVGIAPNERLLEAMDQTLVSGGPSARRNLGKGAVLRCRYDQAIVGVEKPEIGKPPRDAKAKKGAVSGARIAPSAAKGTQALPTMNGPGRYRLIFNPEARAARAGVVAELLWEEKGRIPPAGLRRLATGERAAAFDADAVSASLTVRPLRQGDRIRPFGLDAEKKVKEILIDRKVPREERWGRPVVCDAGGRILWIPGVVRSAHAPVTGETRRTIMLRWNAEINAPRIGVPGTKPGRAAHSPIDGIPACDNMKM